MSEHEMPDPAMVAMLDQTMATSRDGLDRLVQVARDGRANGHSDEWVMAAIAGSAISAHVDAVTLACICGLAAVRLAREAGGT